MKAYNLKIALEYPDKITHLFIYNRNLDQIPEPVFRLKKLSVLSLGNNRLKELPERLLELKALEEIDLSANQFEEFPKVLTTLSTLRKINLEGNRLMQLPSEIKQLQALEIFNSANNQLTQLPDELFLPTLKSLNLSGNQIKKLPKKVIKSMHLQKLFLQKNQLQILPPHLFHCSHLTTLQLDDNRLKKLNDEIGLLQKLEQLTLRNNKLKEVPENIGACTFLRELDISENKLTRIPNSIGQLKWLFYLNLKKNKLSELPANLGELAQLKKLNLEYNQLKRLPQSWIVLSRLQHLLLKGNNIEVLKTELLHPLQLKKISGLSKVLSTKERRQLLTFLKYSRQQQLTLVTREEYYELMNSDKLLSKKVLITALGFPMKMIREKAQQQLLKHHNANQPITKQSKLTILGRSNFNKKNVAQELSNIGVTYQANIDEDTSHVVLGDHPNQTALLKSKALSLLSEKELQHYLMQHAKQTQEAFTPEAIANLQRLLLSDQPANLRLAIQILQHTHFPKALITELFIAFKTYQNPTIKRALRTFLQLNASEQLEEKMKRRIPLNASLPKEKLLKNIHRYAVETELNQEKLETFFDLDE